MISYPGLVKNYVSYFDNPTRKNYLSLGVTLATIVVLLLMIYPAVIYVLDLNNQLTNNRQVNQLLTEKITALNQVQKTIDSLSDNLLLIDESLPDEAQVGEYLNELEAAMQQTQTRVSNVQFEETPISTSATTPAQVVTVKYNLTLSGPYANLKSSLEILEKFGRFTDIVSASFSNKGGDGSNLKLILEARTYFYGATHPKVGAIPQ